MTSIAQRRATANHRRRNAQRGLMRVEVRASAADADLIRGLAEKLRSDPAPASDLRLKLRDALVPPVEGSLLDVFGSDLPDEAFEGVFDQPRNDLFRDVDL